MKMKRVKNWPKGDYVTHDDIKKKMTKFHIKIIPNSERNAKIRQKDMGDVMKIFKFGPKTAEGKHLENFGNQISTTEPDDEKKREMINTWTQGSFTSDFRNKNWPTSRKKKTKSAQQKKVRISLHGNAICSCNKPNDAKWITTRLNLASRLEQLFKEINYTQMAGRAKRPDPRTEPTDFTYDELVQRNKELSIEVVRTWGIKRENYKLKRENNIMRILLIICPFLFVIAILCIAAL